MDYGKYYMGIVFISFIFAIFMIWNVSSLQTTWLGTYTPNEHVRLENEFTYSNVYFARNKCEKWINKMKTEKSEGKYICGKNCSFDRFSFPDCEQMFLY